MEYNLQGAGPLGVIGGAAYSNYGRIENFAVVYKSDLTAHDNFGGICRGNYSGGIVKNGYAYVGSSLLCTFVSALIEYA